MAFPIIAEALARIEHKLDTIITRLQFLGGPPSPQLHFQGTICPLCLTPIEYQIDISHGVVVRKCGCKTGKLPPHIPLFPSPGASNAIDSPADQSSDRPGRSGKDRGRGEEG